MKTIVTSDFSIYDINQIGDIIKLYASEKDKGWREGGMEIAGLCDYGDGVNIALLVNDTKFKKINLDYSQVFDLFLVLREYFKGRHIFEGELKRVDM